MSHAVGDTPDSAFPGHVVGHPALPAPADRPQGRRRAMRVLLVDDRSRLLLFRDSDLGLSPVPRWWITPGGGVDPGESDREAAVREIAEETGLVVAGDDLIGPVATRHVLHGYSDVVTAQDEVFWLVRTRAFTVDTSGHTEVEQLTMTAHRWWTSSQLEETAEEFWPRDLVTIWRHADALAGDPGAVPLDLGVVEESTVPV